MEDVLKLQKKGDNFLNKWKTALINTKILEFLKTKSCFNAK